MVLLWVIASLVSSRKAVQATPLPATRLKPAKEATERFKKPPVTMYCRFLTNVRTEPNTSSKVSTTLQPNTVISVSDYNDQYWKFKGGFISKDLLKPYDKSKHLNIGLDYEYQDFIRYLLKLYKVDVDEYYFYGVIYAESRFNPKTYSSAGAKGIIQVMPSTRDYLLPALLKRHPELSKELSGDIWDIKDNLATGIFTIAYYAEAQKVTCNTYPHMTLTSYNRGMAGAYSYYKSKGTYTSAYSKQVLRAADYIRKNKTWKEGI